MIARDKNIYLKILLFIKSFNKINPKGDTKAMMGKIIIMCLVGLYVRYPNIINSAIEKTEPIANSANENLDVLKRKYIPKMNKIANEYEYV